MGKLLSFMAGRQFRKTILRESDARYKMITYVLVIAVASLSIGWFLASFYDAGMRKQASTIEMLPLFVSLFLAVNFLLLDFYPVYKINPFLFPGYYPIGKYAKAFTVFIIYSINYYSLFVLLTYLFFVTMSRYFGIPEVLFSLVLVYSAYLVNRTIKNVTEYRVPGGKTIFSAVVAATAGYLTFLYHFPLESGVRYILTILLALILFILFAHSEDEKKVKISRPAQNRLLKSNMYANVLSNKNLITTISYAFFFRALWLLVAILGMNDSTGSADVSRVTWQFVSPLILFLYTGVNFFGYSKNLFFTSAIRETDLRNLSSVYFKIIGLLMVIDSLMFWLFTWATDTMLWEHILFYYSSVVVLAVLSFWLAVYHPRFTDNFLFFDFSLIKNRGKDFNLWGVGLLVLVSFILDEVRYTDYQVDISALLVAGALASLYLQPADHSRIIQSAFHELKNR